MEYLINQMKSLRCPATYVENLTTAMDTGMDIALYTQIISWLSCELRSLLDLECFVHSIESLAELEVFMVELSSFLRELNCPHASLTDGPLNERLNTLENKNLLIFYLISELQAARVNWTRSSEQSKRMTVKVLESQTAKCLKGMLITLNFKKPPPTITAMQIFTRVERKLTEMINQGSVAGNVKPLLTRALTAEQWFRLSNLKDEMQEEYEFRRALLLTRLDVTIISFSWSERLKNADEAIQKAYASCRSALALQPTVRMSDVLASQIDLLLVEAASSASVRKFTKSSINQVVIGAVPDRGGRPEEQQPPPPEVPSWQKNEPVRSAPNFQRAGVTYSGGDSHRGDVGKEFRYKEGTQSSSQSNNSYVQGHGRGGRDNYAAGGRGGNRGGQTQRPYVNSHSFGGGHAMPPSSDYAGSGDYKAIDHFQHTVIPTVPYAPAANMYHYAVPTYSPHGDVGFGVGIGGYGATGGNFQQYGVIHNQAYNGNDQPRNVRGSYRSRRAAGNSSVGQRGYHRGH